MNHMIISSVSNDMTSLRSAIKEVLDNSIMAGNISSDQAKSITEQLSDALVLKDNQTTNGTVKNETLSLRKVEEQLKTMRDKINTGCVDTMDGCKRFKDAGICPFVSAFMSGACAKTCDTCATHVKTSELVNFYISLFLRIRRKLSGILIVFL